jgi:hypothetical protein
VQNPGPPVDLYFTWQGKHDDPEIGREIFFDKNTFTVQTGLGWYYSLGTIPSDVPAGTYLNRVTVTVGGQEFVRESRFEVVGEEKPSCPTPTITVSPGAGEVGDEITVQGKDWLPGGTVTITFTGVIEGYVVSSVQVSDSGEWESSFAVPDEPAGDFDYDLVVSENHEGCELRITQAFVIKLPPTDTDIPGGMWISPDNNFVIKGDTLHFAAHAYDNQGGSGVDYVDFTVSYSGKDWFVACKETAPTKDDVYECDWDVSKVPDGPITVSFDVYDKAGNKNIAPDGVREGQVQRSSSPPPKPPGPPSSICAQLPLLRNSPQAATRFSYLR